MMSSVVVCDECGTSIRVPENLIGSGKRVVCPKCREPLKLNDKTSATRKAKTSPAPGQPTKTAGSRTSPTAGAQPRQVAKPKDDEDGDLVPIQDTDSPKSKAPAKPGSPPPNKKPIYEEDEDEGGTYDVNTPKDEGPPPEIASAEKMFSGKNSPEARARRKMKGTVEQWAKVRTGI